MDTTTPSPACGVCGSAPCFEICPEADLWAGNQFLENADYEAFADPYACARIEARRDREREAQYELLEAQDWERTFYDTLPCPPPAPETHFILPQARLDDDLPF